MFELTRKFTKGVGITEVFQKQLNVIIAVELITTEDDLLKTLFDLELSNSIFSNRRIDEIIRQVIFNGRPVSHVSKEMGVAATTITGYLSKACRYIRHHISIGRRLRDLYHPGENVDKLKDATISYLNDTMTFEELLNVSKNIQYNTGFSFPLMSAYEDDPAWNEMQARKLYRSIQNLNFREVN